MKILLVEQEIKEALQQYLQKVINISEDKQVDIDILATRGTNGVTAEVNICAKRQDEVKVEKQEEPFKDEVATTAVEEVFAAPQVEVAAPKKSLFGSLSAIK
jgi:hypothetical protein